MSDKDTIAAIATPSGYGGVGIIRVSGDKASVIAESMLGKCPQPRRAVYGPFLDTNNKTIDRGIALYFRAPHSFTGEDVLELHGHGGPVVLDMLMQRTLELGARSARAGEFSERAFLNNKIDLTQAEAIADLISAQSHEAARAAMHSLEGDFSAAIHDLVEQLTQLRMYIESALDFPEEEIDFLADKSIADELKKIGQQLAKVKQSTRQGRLLRDGVTVVIAGKPNAGKSSLLNQLVGHEAAIVTDIPGTTRDVLREHIQLDGLPLHIIDTAGLRDSDDKIEQEGMRRALQAIEQADQILYILDDNDPVDEETIKAEWLPDNIDITFIHNKIDLNRKKPAITHSPGEAVIYLSAKTGEGIDLLRKHLKTSMGYEEQIESKFIARRRHLEAIESSEKHVEAAQQHLKNTRAGELVAEELKYAQQALTAITGEFSSDDLLGRIFSDFCIGK